jgi:hypothetical protein
MLFFLCVFFLPDGGEGIEKNRDGHYWGYIARERFLGYNEDGDTRTEL